MKVKIKKGSKSKEFNLINNWTEVSLKSYIKLISFKTGTKSEEATEMILALSDIPQKLIQELSLADVSIIMNKLGEIQAKQETKLKRIIKINEVEYGIHPDFSEITLGEYADIEQLFNIGIEKNLPELMSILYRPIKEKHKNGIYVIDAYDGNITMRAEEMKQMSAEQVQSALVFFYHFVKILFEIMELFSMKTLKEMKIQ